MFLDLFKYSLRNFYEKWTFLHWKDHLANSLIGFALYVKALELISDQRRVEETNYSMKRNAVIFLVFWDRSKMLYTGSLGSKNLSKFSFRVQELFIISRKLTCKIKICAQFPGHTWAFFKLFLMSICPNIMNEVF